MTEPGLQNITSSRLTQMPQCLPLGQFFGLENFLLKILVKCNVSSGKGEGINHYLYGQSLELFSNRVGDVFVLFVGDLPVWLFITGLLRVRHCLNKTDIISLLSKIYVLVRGEREKPTRKSYMVCQIVKSKSGQRNGRQHDYLYTGKSFAIRPHWNQD